MSNAFRLPNGNTLINSGSPGRIFEITPDREIAWDYEIPINRDTPLTQGTTPRNNANFRAYKYSSDYAGFDGIDLFPGLPIELNPLDCALMTSSTADSEEPTEVVILSFLPQSNTLHLETPGNTVKAILVTDMQGRLLEQPTYSYPSVALKQQYQLGSYLVTVIFENGNRVSKKLLLH